MVAPAETIKINGPSLPWRGNQKGPERQTTEGQIPSFNVPLTRLVPADSVQSVCTMQVTLCMDMAGSVRVVVYLGCTRGAGRLRVAQKGGCDPGGHTHHDAPQRTCPDVQRRHADPKAETDRSPQESRKSKVKVDGRRSSSVANDSAQRHPVWTAVDSLETLRWRVDCTVDCLWACGHGFLAVWRGRRFWPILSFNVRLRICVRARVGAFLSNFGEGREEREGREGRRQIAQR